MPPMMNNAALLGRGTCLGGCGALRLAQGDHLPPGRNAPGLPGLARRFTEKDRESSERPSGKTVAARCCSRYHKLTRLQPTPQPKSAPFPQVPQATEAVKTPGPSHLHPLRDDNPLHSLDFLPDSHAH